MGIYVTLFIVLQSTCQHFFHLKSGIFFIGINSFAEESDNIINSCVTSEYSVKYQYRTKKTSECTIQRTFKEKDKIDPGC